MSTGSLMTRQTYDRAPRLTNWPLHTFQRVLIHDQIHFFTKRHGHPRARHNNPRPDRHYRKALGPALHTHYDGICINLVRRVQIYLLPYVKHRTVYTLPLECNAIDPGQAQTAHGTKCGNVHPARDAVLVHVRGDSLLEAGQLF